MTSKRQRAASAIALFLVFSLSQVYVQANLASKSSTASVAAPAVARAGKLTTRGNNPITVNGNLTNSGTTILSGALLQTPAEVGASVQIGKKVLLRMAPKTKLTLSFNDSTVDVVLESGLADLTTAPGMKGSITTPDGKTALNDSTKLSTIVGQKDDKDKDKDKDDDDDDKDKGGGYLGSGEGEGLLGGASNSSARAFGLVVLGGAVAAAILITMMDDDGRGSTVSLVKP
jgi:hypothetical protein